MKKNSISALALAAVLLFSTGCGAGTAEKMSLSPAVLTRNEEELLDFVTDKDQVHLFDYTFDDSIQSVTIKVMTRNGQGEWEGAGGMSSPSHLNNEAFDKTGRVMISLEEDGLVRFAHRRNNGESSWSSESVKDSLVGPGAKHIAWQADAVDIVPNQPIPVALFGRSEKNTFRSGSLSDYPDTETLIDYDTVSVIAVCFSTQPLEQPAE